MPKTNRPFAKRQHPARFGLNPALTLCSIIDYLRASISINQAKYAPNIFVTKYGQMQFTAKSLTSQWKDRFLTYS